MKKKIIGILLISAMLGTNAGAAVIDSVREDTKSGAVTVTGSGLTASEEVLVEMFDYAAGRTKPEFIGVFNADENGGYNAVFTVPDSVDSGSKEIFVKPFISDGASEKLQFYSAKGLETVISEWNSAVENNDASAMCRLIDSEAAVKILLNSACAEKIANELKSADKTELAKKLIETGKTDGIEDASEKFTPLYIIFAVNKLSPDTCAELTAEFYDYIDSAKGDVFKDILSVMPEDKRLALYKSAAERIDGEVTKEGFTALIYEEAVMAGLKSIEHYGDINPYMKKYNDDYFKLNFSEYNKLKNTYPVDSKVISQRNSYKTFAELETLFKGWVNDEKSAEQKSLNKINGSGGGSGSSSGGTKTNYLPVAPVTEKIENETVFDDLAGYEWAEKYIMQLYGKNVINGIGDKKYSPGGSVTREQFIKLMSVVTDLTESEENCGFEDVKAGEWYEGYINAAKKAGLVNGISDTLFGIGEKITRQDAAVMLLNAIKLYNSALVDKTEMEQPDFADKDDIASYAVYSVAMLNRLGIMQGADDGKFYPRSETSRAEAAVMICRVLELIG